MPIQGGYYIKARCIQESWIAHSAPVVRELWDYLLREANHKESKTHGFIIKRGQLFRSYREIRDSLHWMVGCCKKVYTANQMKHSMSLLSKHQMIDSSNQPRGVLITICNYDYYQTQKNYESTSESTSDQPANQPVINWSSPSINKNVKKEKNVKKNKPPIVPHEEIEINKDEIQEIFDYWNSLHGPVTHRSIDEFKSCIRARLKIYRKEEITESIRNYAKILTCDDYYWTHKYSLNDFLERKVNNIDRFATRNDPFKNFLTDKKPKKETGIEKTWRELNDVN